MNSLDTLFRDVPEQVNPERAALILAISPQLVRILIRAKHDPIPAYKVGGHWLILRDDLHEWMNGRRNRAHN